MIQRRVDLKPFLETVLEDGELHARWLSTLSMLEHTGARKIHKCMPALPDDLGRSLNVLQHAAEESRHAFFFAKQIQRLRTSGSAHGSAEADALDAGGSVDSHSQEMEGSRTEQKSGPLPLPLCYWPALKYFQSLDAMCQKRASKLLPSSPRRQTLYCYLAVTYLIEERAVDVYRAYEELLRQRELPIQLSGLLKEEEGHMSEILVMAQMLPLDFEAELRSLALQETALFERFAESLGTSALSAIAAAN
ncbi:MAG: hypothetical protein KDK37_13410 [Leptospiraceae bacterium]|nr:hypothetical protein [Leptospiraceae bacterium]